jgi:hypothetical protein
MFQCILWEETVSTEGSSHLSSLYTSLVDFHGSQFVPNLVFPLLWVVGFYVENLKMDFGGRFEVAVHIAFYRSNFLTCAWTFRRLCVDPLFLLLQQYVQILCSCQQTCWTVKSVLHSPTKSNVQYMTCQVYQVQGHRLKVLKKSATC